jgi:putative transcriptional regulator
MEPMDERDEPHEADLGTATLRGRLLVASPLLGDPNFERTVILLIEHGPEGALGLVLNRPSEMPVDEVLPQWESRAAVPKAMFIGGPVQPNAVICLARTDGDTGGDEGANDLLATTAVPGIAMLDLDGDRDDVGEEVALRCFAGYAGWSEGQLEAEIEEGSWFVLDPLPDDPFVPSPSGLWQAVLARQPGRLARYARYPADPSVN